MTARRDEASFFEKYFEELALRMGDATADSLGELCAALTGARDRGRKVIVAGNGASAAIASHVAVDLTKTVGIRAVTFNEPDLITCFANDYGYELWLAKALESYADADDVAVLISSSGKSPNIVNAAKTARERALKVVTLSGFDAGNPLRRLGDLNLWVNSSSYNVVESTHQAWMLAAIDMIASTGIGGLRQR